MSASLVERLSHLDAASIADARNGLGIVHPSISSLVPGLKLTGPARTVKCYPGSIITVHRALVESQPGDVLVIDGEGDVRAGALLGELMAREAVDRGIQGVVVDGAVRDIAGLRRLSFPTFASAATPRVGVNRRLGQTNVPVAVGGMVVHPGDYVLADDDGVAIIPRADLEKIVEAGEAIELKEVGYAAAIDRHERIVDILGIGEAVRG